MKYENLYVASYNPNEVFNLQNFTFKNIIHQYEPGEVIKLENEVFSQYNLNNELSEEEKKEFDNNNELLKLINEIITKKCTGMIVYDVAWWAMGFNRFMQGFCNRHFEV